jgi:uncharacterized damage-inducible protein DinB
MTSAFIDNYRFLARYNAWFNERLYGACDALSDAQRLQDHGAYFGSIHGTLNHLLWGDTMWLQRFNAQGVVFAAFAGGVLSLPAGASYATVLEPDWAALKARRERLDAAIEAWVAQMPEEFPLRTMRYANTRGVWREHPAWQAMTHFFNHQAHHRGQATTLLSQAGVDVGVTDLIALV